MSGPILDWVDTSPGLSVWPKFNAHTTSLTSLKHFDPLKYFLGDCMWLADEPVIGLAITWSHLSGHVFQILKMTFHPSYISDQPNKHPRAPWKVKKSKNNSVGQCHLKKTTALISPFGGCFLHDFSVSIFLFSQFASKNKELCSPSMRKTDCSAPKLKNYPGSLWK